MAYVCSIADAFSRMITGWRIAVRLVPKTCRSSARPHHPLRHRIAASSPRCASASAWTRSGHTMASPTSTVRIAAPGTKFKEVVIRFC
jgi:hypothetical protein